MATHLECPNCGHRIAAKPGKAGLTRRQNDLLTIIEDAAVAGVAPSYAEMRAALGVASNSAVHKLVIQLERRGHIVRAPGQNRGLALVA